MVDYRAREPAGTIVIDTANTYLYLVLGNGKAMRYGIGVGREGFTWSGAERVSRMAEWPDWHPPAEMIERQPYLPRFMAGGEGNPLGARALYLGKTLYRIHGTNQPSTIGTFVSSGCIRLTNEDITDLYSRVQVGTRVVVLPGRPPASASAAPVAPPIDQTPPEPYNPLAPPRTRYRPSLSTCHCPGSTRAMLSSHGHDRRLSKCAQIAMIALKKRAALTPTRQHKGGQSCTINRDSRADTCSPVRQAVWHSRSGRVPVGRRPRRRSSSSIRHSTRSSTRRSRSRNWRPVMAAIFGPPKDRYGGRKAATCCSTTSKIAAA